jgi:DNA-binding NtrC family response regulator
MPVIKLNQDAEQILVSYYWPGNVRQLKNITEQISIIERNREINRETLLTYLPNYGINSLPVLSRNEGTQNVIDVNERDIFYKAMLEMKKDLNDLKLVVHDIVVASQGKVAGISNDDVQIVNRMYNDLSETSEAILNPPITYHQGNLQKSNTPINQTIEVEESLSLQDKEIDMIKRALKKHKGKRKYAAQELGISERTLYRKINEYKIEE